MDDMLTASIEAVLTDRCTPAFVREVERVRDRKVGRDLWRQLDELGFIDALVPESAGGSGISLDDAAGVLFAFGRYAMPLPAVHTMLGRRLLAEAGMEAPRGPIALAVLDGTESRTTFVPYGLVCDWILIESSDGLSLVDINDVTVELHEQKGSLDAIFTFAAGAGQHIRGARCAFKPAESVFLELGALVTATTMAGAMIRVLDITISHVNDRQQFGRSIGKFQAVQHKLSVMAEHAAATHIAAQLACGAESSSQHRLTSAIAKARASRAAPLIANAAHALTGAMGVTAEYDLQLFTRRLHSQRLQFGSESFWDEVIGSYAVDHWDSVAQGVVSMST
jgi:acyl-CoA dehydrogenase